MSRKLVLTLCLCIFTLISTGCGEKDNNDDNASITYEEFTAQSPKLLAEYICDGVFTCPESQSINMLILAGRFQDKADCIANLPDALGAAGAQFNKESAAIKDGRQEFNSDSAAKCIASIKDKMKQCANIDILTGSSELNDCDKAFTPKVELNAPCAADNECISNNCSRANTSECFGRCAAAIEPAKEGESCDQADCTTGLACVAKSNDDSARICAKVGSRQKGENCEGAPDACADKLTCTIQGTCDEPVPLAKATESCDLTKTICTPGLTCVGLEIDMQQQTLVGTCGPARAIGGSCIMDLECQSNLYCTGSFSAPGECSTKKKAGEACESELECGSALTCDTTSKTCVTPKDDSVTCEIPK